MNKLAIYAFLSIFLAFCPALGSFAEDTAAPALNFRKDTLSIRTGKGSSQFNIEIAETRDQQIHGLMGRKTLPDDYGMLFFFPTEQKINMWMKNTPHSLDMLFIDSHGKIVYIAAKTKPESTKMITAGKPVRAVLELPGGAAAKRKIKVGDQVQHKYFEP